MRRSFDGYKNPTLVNQQRFFFSSKQERIITMKIHDKISKIADWIINESNSSADEVEHLLYALYESKSSGLSGNINDDYNDVLSIMYNRDEDE